MNILYGVNATGNGHISRSRITISELKKRGHNVTVLFSGRKVKDFFDLEQFRPYVIKKGSVSYTHLTLPTKRIV